MLKPDPVPASSAPARRWVVMGVSGCGKSRIGSKLAVRLGARSIEGDDFHPPANIAKMRAGIPLDDADRHSWLLRLRDELLATVAHGQAAVLSCSALKRRYRDILREADPNLVFVHLDGNRNLIAGRMQARDAHYMPLSLLDSQYRDLEPLQSDEKGAQFDVAVPPDLLVEQVLERLS